MSQLIRDGQFIEDCWRWLDADEAPAPAPGEHLILPSAVWQAHRPGLDAARTAQRRDLPGAHRQERRGGDRHGDPHRAAG